MREIESQRHIVLGLVDGIAEHHSLIACTLQLLATLPLFADAAHTAVDILALFMDSGKDTACIAVEAVGTAVVTDIGDELARHVLYIDVCLRADLAGHHHLASGAERLDSHMALRVAGKKFIEKCIADLVGHLVGMTLGNRFRSKKIIHCYILLLFNIIYSFYPFYPFATCRRHVPTCAECVSACAGTRKRAAAAAVAR